MNESYDINRLPSDGYIVFPLSMSRLNTGQNPEKCYDALEHFFEKISKFGIDVVFLYTNGLYQNNTDTALEVRKKTNQQMLTHSDSLKKIIQKRKKFIPQAFHFIPWDYIILNSPKYQSFLEKLQKTLKQDQEFLSCIKLDLKKKDATKENINFVLEEIAITHIIRQKLIEFPKTLVKNDDWRLIVYPGSFIKSDFYQYKNNVLPKTTKDFKFKAAHYDLLEKKLFNFEQMLSIS